MNVPALALESTSSAAPWTDRGLSEEAQTVRQLLDEASGFYGSLLLGEPRRLALEELDAVYAAASEDNWDGIGSAAVEENTYVYARQFLASLPSTAPMPEVLVDRDGEFSFDWDYGPRRVFSVSVGRDGTLNYAGLFGHSIVHGVEHLSEGLPRAISDNLQRVIAQPE